MASIEEEFKKYSENIKNIKNTPSDNDLLILYGLYKQATVGDCNTQRPGFLDFRGKSKWDSWNKYKNISKEEAMQKYIDKCKEIIK